MSRDELNNYKKPSCRLESTVLPQRRADYLVISNLLLNIISSCFRVLTLSVLGSWP